MKRGNASEGNFYGAGGVAQEIINGHPATVSKSKVTLQEFAEFLRNAAYADNLEHGIEWSLNVIHPRTDWGAVGFTGGIWHKPLNWIFVQKDKAEKRRRGKPSITINFSFDETKGIYNFVIFEDDNEVKSCSKYQPFNGAPTFDEFKKIVIEKFGITNLYRVKGDLNAR